jgi:thioredoxin 1
MNRMTIVRAIFLGMLAIATVACADDSKSQAKNAPTPAAKAATLDSPKVTFVELGSANCIPCKAMRKVMDSLEVKYPKDLKIVFHDVWTDAGKPAAQEFGIRMIPTQVFLDAKGVEYFRHEGYFPMVELEKILKQKQVSK